MATPTYISITDIKIYFFDAEQYAYNDLDSLLAAAEEDVINYFTYNWFPKAWSSYYNTDIVTVNGTSFTPTIDLSKLNTTVLSKLMVYRALGEYIYLSLAKTTNVDEDSFYARALEFQKKYYSELKLLLETPLYDFNGDTQFDNIDINSQRKISSVTWSRS